MLRVSMVVVLALAAGAAVAPPLGAQTDTTVVAQDWDDAEDQSGFNVSVGGGVTIPVSDFGDAADLGWHGLAGLGVTSANSSLGFRADFFYGENKASTGSADFRLIGGLGNLILNLGQSERFRPYLIGSAGYFNVRVDGGGDESDIVAGGGLGFKIPAGSDANIFVEGRYINIFAAGNDVQFIPVTAGIQFFTR